MKNLIIIAVALASVNAFASRARMTSLGNSPHLIDTQTIFSNPADMYYVGGDFVAIESGGTTGAGLNTPNANAEGQVVRTFGDAKMGLALGHQSKNASSWATGLRGFAGVPALTLTGNANQQNPVEISYGMKMGDMAVSGTLVYSNYSDKKNDEKESSAGLRGGMRMGPLDAKVAIGLGSVVETPTSKYKGTGAFSIGAGYVMDTMYFSGLAEMGAAKRENGSGAEVSNVTTQLIEVGMVNSHKKDGNEFFYGVKLSSATSKDAATPTPDLKLTTLSLPITLGLEVDALSWLTLRGSVTQSVLISSSKLDLGATTPTEYAPGPNTTVAALGAGLKFNNKLTLDGTLSTGSTQTVNTTNLLAQAGLTYLF